VHKNEPNHHQSPEVIVFEASAGSGKTYALAKRYLELIINSRLADQLSLRTILAITFTNKATIEMKERIIELLKKISLDAFASKEEKDDIYSHLGISQKTAQHKAYRAMDELINHYTFFQVQTIDSFINALLLGCSLNIDRSAHFKIKRNYHDYLAYCLDCVIEEALTDKDVFTFFEKFLEHYLFVENRSAWFPREDILKLVQSLFSLSNKYGGRFQAYQGTSADLIKRKRALLEELRNAYERLPQGINGTVKNSLGRFVETKDVTFQLKDIPDKFQYAHVPMNKNSPSPGEFKKIWDRLRRKIKELAELDATVTYNPYVRLFQRMLDYFQSVSRDDDILFLEELNFKARALFGDGGLTVAELYYRLATRFVHYLIDEFQDTSILQWRNLEVMVKEALASGGSLFYVGDKKQAIYRFRGGQAELFDKVKEELRPYVKEHVLTQNWRSQRAIVDFNNTIFSQDNLEAAFGRLKMEEDIGKDSLAKILKVFEDSHQHYQPYNSHGYVCIERIDESSQAQRNELMKGKLVSLVNQLRERFSYKDIAVLCRDNDEVELVTSWLLEEAIPVESEKTLNVAEHFLIKEIIALLKFLHSPIDDLNFSSFILGEIFRVSSDMSLEEVTQFLFHVRTKAKDGEQFSLYRHFRKTFPKAWSHFFDEFFKAVGFLQPYELVISIYERFKVFEHFCEAQAFFMKFLDVLKDREEEYVSLGDFLHYFATASRDDLYVSFAESDSIHVLTIHKSKGLEFGLVIVPFLRMDITPETAGKGTNSYLTHNEEGQFGLVRITKEHRKYSPTLRDLWRQGYTNSCIDELNNMYVALTRARSELYIFMPAKSGIAYNKARGIIPEDVKEFGAKRSYKKANAHDTSPVITFAPSCYRDWVGFLHNEFIDLASVRNRTRIIEGTFMHAVLSEIGNMSIQGSSKVLSQAITQARTQFPYLADIDPLTQKLKQLITSSEAKRFFYVDRAEVYQEIEVANRYGQRKRIDRLILTQGEVWVIDYKSSLTNEAEYEAQVREYMEIVGELHPRRRVKGFIIYLNELTVKEVHG